MPFPRDFDRIPGDEGDAGIFFFFWLLRWLLRWLLSSRCIFFMYWPAVYLCCVVACARSFPFVGALLADPALQTLA